MCRGLAIVVEKIGDEWEVYAMGGCGSHDQLLSYLDDGLKYAKRPHLKFELLYPNVLVDDIVQECANDPRAYPKEWLEYRAGRWRAVMSAFSAVMQFISEHPSLTISFTPKMMEGAQLYGANLSGADLSRADLSRADLYGADLSRADLSRADLSRANLSGADLPGLTFPGLTFTGLTFPGLTFPGLTFPGLTFTGLTFPGLTFPGLTFPGLTFPGLTFPGLTFPGLT